MSANVSDNEAQQDQHSIWNGRLKTNTKEAKFFLEFLDALSERFDTPNDEILQTFWGEPRDVLEKLIKKANKREKKVEAKFAAKDLKKPSNANILFQRDFKAKCDKTGSKFDLKASAAAYKALTDKERAKYVAEAQRLKAEYTVEYERLRAAAIKSGAFPADKPKKPLTAYFRYLNDVRPQLQEKYAGDEDRRAVNGKVAKDSAGMWKALTDKQREKYETAYQKDKEQYDAALAKWEATETNRRKGNDQNSAGGAAAVAIESSGSKKTKAPAAAPSAAAPSTATSDSEAEAPTEVVKPAKQTRVKPAPVKAAAVVESEQENDEEPAPAPVKAAKGKAKPATK
jgi:HMG (high mobility group) box